MARVFLPAKSSAFASCQRFTPIMYLMPAGIGAMPAPIGRGKARGEEFVRGAHRGTGLRKKVEAYTACELASETVGGWCTHI